MIGQSWKCADHPLAREFRDGISFDRLVDIYSLYGHNVMVGVKA